MTSPLMLPVYDAALNRVRANCAAFDGVLRDPSTSEPIRRSMRERRDYWHALGSKIHRRMDRERNRHGCG